MSAPPPGRDGHGLSPLLRTAAIALLLYVFLLGIKGLGEGFELLGGDLLERFFAATENPFIGLIVGLLATTVVQSSSVTTSMVVALVAAPENPLPLANAVPMIMGANIGTTVTCTIVALGHLGRPEEFRRAFPVAVCHDLFNYFTVIVLLPLELLTGFLRHTAVAIGSLVGDFGGVTYRSPVRSALDAGYAPIETISGWIATHQIGQAVLVIATSAVLIFAALFLLVRLLRGAATGRIEALVASALGSTAVLSMLIGIVATVMVQSSSLTTSLLVPLAAAGLLRLEQAFPVTLGANVGTTITAFMAALAVSGPNAVAGLEIAIVHLLFNVVGIAIIYPFEPVRRVPLRLARAMGRLAMQSRVLVVVAIAAAFYGIPALVLLVSRWLN